MKETDFIRKKQSGALRLAFCPLADGGELPLLEFPLLADSGLVRHGFTTREGGVSAGEFAALNLSFSRGDNASCVKENFRRVAEAFGCTPNDIVCSDQTHTVNVLRVDSRFAGAGVSIPKPYTDVDGLITDERGLLLATFFADCVPLFFVDPVHRAIGLSHSGWRGTVRRMGAVTLDAMRDAFGTRPCDVFAAVGPSICQDCYEVGEEVAQEFADAFPEWKKELLFDQGDGKYRLDLWRCNERILLAAGILREHLSVTDICTCCNPSLLFSHRASHGRRGNLGAFLMLPQRER